MGEGFTFMTIILVFMDLNIYGKSIAATNDTTFRLNFFFGYTITS